MGILVATLLAWSGALTYAYVAYLRTKRAVEMCRRMEEAWKAATTGVALHSVRTALQHRFKWTDEDESSYHQLMRDLKSKGIEIADGAGMLRPPDSSVH